MMRRAEAWAKLAFALDVPQPDGHTARAHLNAAKNQGATAAELEALGLREPPPPPSDISHRVLPLFYRLSGARKYVGDGIPVAIADTDILAWSTLREERLSFAELTLLDVLDQTWLQVMRRKGAPADD